MLQHNRRRHIRWLRCVPISFSAIQLGRQRLMEPPIIDGTFQSALPARLAE
jgi:hypothetical protein